MSRSAWEKLDRIERLAKGSVPGRFLHAPLTYVKAIGYWRLIYPISKKGRYALAKTFFGANMRVVLPAATEIYLFGAKTHDSEIRLARYLLHNLKPGDSFCDVGAHFGYFSLLAAHLVGDSGKVISLEASPSTFGILKKNTAAFPQIHPHFIAVSDSQGTVTFHEFPALYSEYNSMILPEGESAGWMKKNPPSRVEVPAVRLDQFLLDHQFYPKIVKIDVEGAEAAVLNGFSQYLENSNPILIMEYIAGGSHTKAVSMAAKLGFQVYLITETGHLQKCTDLEKAMKERSLLSDNIVLKRS